MEVTCEPNPCASLSGPRVLITETAAADCSYTAEATCTVSGLAQATIQFNGAPPNVAFPQTLTCNSGTGQYTYLMGGVPTVVNSIECICGPNSCGWTFSGGATLNPPQGVGAPINPPDMNCIYTLQAECTPATKTMITFGPPPLETFMVPKMITCPAGYTGYLYITNGGTESEIFGANCP
uniref:CUB domain-containing protein n=1 Tax=Panagrolaimus superbus TaxID=310955 RepID=A0A914Z2S3_9BILA